MSEKNQHRKIVDIILRISEEWEEFQKFKSKEAKSVFKECLKQLSTLKKKNFSQDTIESLRGGASLINRLEEFQYPGDLYLTTVLGMLITLKAKCSIRFWLGRKVVTTTF